MHARVANVRYMGMSVIYHQMSCTLRISLGHLHGGVFLSPPSSKGHAYILAATDYFSKRAEAVPLKQVQSREVVDFIKAKILHRYGVPSKITSDNGTPFKNKESPIKD